MKKVEAVMKGMNMEFIAKAQMALEALGAIVTWEEVLKA